MTATAAIQQYTDAEIIRHYKEHAGFVAEFGAHPAHKAEAETLATEISARGLELPELARSAFHAEHAAQLAAKIRAHAKAEAWSAAHEFLLAA